MVKDFDYIINNLPKKQNFFVHEILRKPYFIRSKDFQSDIAKYQDEMVFKNDKINYYFLIIVITMCVFSIIKYDKHNDSFYFASGIIVFIFIFSAFRKFKKHKKIIINKNGFFLEDKIFNWQDIYDYGLFVRYTANSKSSDLYIFSKIDGFKKFSLSDYHQNEVIHALNFYRNKSQIKF